MSRKKTTTVTLRSESHKKPAKDISQEPAFKRLKEIFDGMSDEEKRRTIDYLKGEKPGEE